MRSIVKYFAIACFAVIAPLSADAAPAKKAPASVSITLTNGATSSLVEFTLIETVPAPAPAPKSTDWWAVPLTWFSSDQPAEPTTRETNLLKAPLASKKSVAVKLGTACESTISAKFEDGSSIDPVTMNFCKDRKLTLTAPAAQ